MAEQTAQVLQYQSDNKIMGFPNTGTFPDVGQSQTIVFPDLSKFNLFAIEFEHDLNAADATLTLGRILAPRRIISGSVAYSETDFADGTNTVTLASGPDSVIFDIQSRQLDSLVLTYAPNSVTSGEFFVKLIASL